MSSKIKHVLQNWPQGGVATLRWLNDEGVDHRLADKYVRAGWLNRVGHGAYMRVGSPVNWAGGIYAIQTQLGLDIHPGGFTAMELRGHSYYISFSGRMVTIFKKPKTSVPSWFLRHPWSQSVEVVAGGAFPDAQNYTSMVEVDGFKIAVSTLELAALEMMSLVPKRQSYEEALQIMVSLPAIRPWVVQQLLESCTSVKAKRLFMHAAELIGHTWLSKLDLSKVDFGSGPRSIHSGGQLRGNYKLVLDDPTEL